MAGSFGYNPEYYDAAMDVGERLREQFTTRETAGRTVIASGTLCLEQLDSLLSPPTTPRCSSSARRALDSPDLVFRSDGSINSRTNSIALLLFSRSLLISLHEIYSTEPDAMHTVVDHTLDLSEDERDGNSSDEAEHRDDRLAKGVGLEPTTGFQPGNFCSDPEPTVVDMTER